MPPDFMNKVEALAGVMEVPESQAGQSYLALHTLGWKSFQDLCAQVCEVVFDRKLAPSECLTSIINMTLC